MQQHLGCLFHMGWHSRHFLTDNVGGADSRSCLCVDVPFAPEILSGGCLQLDIVPFLGGRADDDAYDNKLTCAALRLGTAQFQDTVDSATDNLRNE